MLSQWEVVPFQQRGLLLSTIGTEWKSRTTGLLGLKTTLQKYPVPFATDHSRHMLILSATNIPTLMKDVIVFNFGCFFVLLKVEQLLG